MSIDKNQLDKLSDNRYVIFVCLFLIITTLSIYWPVHTYNFIDFDDNAYVFENQHVKNGLTIDNIKWAFTDFHSNNWHPLTWISHMLDCQIFGLNPGKHHFVNLAFHIANTLLLFFVFRTMTGALWQSAFIAAMFAFHPLHIESVAWIAERKDVLSTFFFMMTLWAYALYTRHPNTYGYISVVIFFTLGLLSKPMVVTLPFVLLLLDYWPLHRIQIDKLSDISHSQQRSTIFRLIAEKIPLFILTSISSIITFYAQKSGVFSLDEIPIHSRVANALVSYLNYIIKMVYPINLGVLYPYIYQQPVWKIFSASCAIVFISLLAVMSIQKMKYLIVGWLWFLVTLIPVIGFVSIGNHSMADRYTYIPFIGLFIIITWGAIDLSRKWGVSKIWVVLSGAIVLMALMAVSIKQIRYWKNSISLFEHTLSITEDNYIIHNNLGLALEKEGRTREATDQYFQAIRIKPNRVKPYYNLGELFEKQGKRDEAIYYYSQAAQKNSDFWQARMKLGDILYDQGRTNEAINLYLQVVKINPDIKKVYNNLGNAFYKEGKIKEAIYYYSQMLKIDPTVAETYNNLGNALCQQKRINEAIKHYIQAIKLKPDFAEAYNSLGVALIQIGNIDKAIICFKKALHIKPDYNSAKNNLNLLIEHPQNH